MRILAISNYYPPHFDGGYEISLKENLDAFSKKGHECFVLCGHKGFPAPKNSTLNFVQKPVQAALSYLDYHHPEGLKPALCFNRNYKICRQALRALKPDIVLLGNQKAISTGAVYAVQDSRIPRIYDVGDDWLRLYKPKGMRALLSAFWRNLKSPAKSFRIDFSPLICPSEWMKADLQSKYNSERIYVLPRGVKLPEPNFRPISAAPRFVFAGRIEPLKGLETVIMAAPDIAKKHPLFYLDIFGEGEESYIKNLEQKIRQLHLQNHFTFQGKAQDMRQVLRDYDILIMPSLARESFGRIIIEAMAEKLIVIASDAYGPSEILKQAQGAFAFPPGNSEALAKVIDELLSLPISRLEDLRQEAYVSVSANYDLELLNNQTELILIKELHLQKIQKRQK